VEVGAKLRLLRVGLVRCRTRNDITLNDVYVRDLEVPPTEQDKIVKLKNS